MNLGAIAGYTQHQSVRVCSLLLLKYQHDSMPCDNTICDTVVQSQVSHYHIGSVWVLAPLQNQNV